MASQSGVSLLTDDDLHLFNEGKHYRLYDKLGAHTMTRGSDRGTYFSVHGRPYSLMLALPPLSVSIFKHNGS